MPWISEVGKPCGGDSYVGEVRLFGGNFAPYGWADCNGQLVNIDEYDALFALIGVTYGGDGQTNFALPDLRARVPVHQGTGPGLSTYWMGQSGGAETQTLTTNQPHDNMQPYLGLRYIISLYGIFPSQQ